MNCVKRIEKRLFIFLKLDKMLTWTYNDFIIGVSDQEFIDELLEKYNIREWDVELMLDWEMYWARFTNAVIYWIMVEIVNKNVENYDDKIKLIDSIYTNCLDSFFDIDVDELETQEAKDLVENF